MQPEFSHIIKLDKISTKPAEYNFSATPAERIALAKRFKIVGIDSFDVAITLQKETARAVRVKGFFKAVVVQTSVVSLNDFTSVIEESFATTFSKDVRDKQAVDVDVNAEDEELLTDDKIDMGELAAEYLALSLPPFPRAEDDAFVYKNKAQDFETKEKSPFAVLKSLKK